MERQAAQRIPKWKVNARTQVHKLAKDNLMNFKDLPFQWNDLAHGRDFRSLLQVLGDRTDFLGQIYSQNCADKKEIHKYP